MPLWSPSLRTGDATLDARHRGLLSLLEAAGAAALRNDRPGVEAGLHRMQADCVAHFEEEQRIMARLAAGGGDHLPGPAVQAHLESHAEFLADLERLRAEVAARGLTALARLWLSSRLVEWLRFHTRTMDAALVAAEARGLPAPGPTVAALPPRPSPAP